MTLTRRQWKQYEAALDPLTLWVNSLRPSTQEQETHSYRRFKGV